MNDTTKLQIFRKIRSYLHGDMSNNTIVYSDKYNKYSLQSTIRLAVDTAIKSLERVAILQPPDEGDEMNACHKCSNCGCVLPDIYCIDEGYNIELNFCPECGSTFLSEVEVSERNCTVTKCSDCAHLRSVGYEYPEYYCEIGISEENEHSTGDGCDLTKQQRAELCKNRDDLWWDESSELCPVVEVN